MQHYKAQAHIHSLNGKMDEITVLEKVGDVIIRLPPCDILAEYRNAFRYDRCLIRRRLNSLHYHKDKKFEDVAVCIKIFSVFLQNFFQGSQRPCDCFCNGSSVNAESAAYFRVRFTVKIKFCNQILLPLIELLYRFM